MEINESRCILCGKDSKDAMLYLDPSGLSPDIWFCDDCRSTAAPILRILSRVEEIREKKEGQ